jgi:TPR repeat protein
MRISSGILAALLMAAASAAAAQQQTVTFASPQAAFEHGLGAYKAGYNDIAIPALTEAAKKGSKSARFYAEFYLARIYSETVGKGSDHPKAYMLFRKLADENTEVDPVDSQRAPFVAKALIALARYARTGLSEIDLAPNPRRATDYLNHAAAFFGDKDAQFELAKVYLSGQPTKDDIRRGIHYLSALTEDSYPAAQAYLAELLWHGRYVKKDEQRALALITMAVENAPAHERIWIEETYYGIFCATTAGTRQGADGFIARWRKIFTRPAPQPEPRMGIGGRDLTLERRCANGEVATVRRDAPKAPIATGPVPTTGPVAAAPPAAKPDPVQGSATSLGFRPQ